MCKRPDKKYGGFFWACSDPDCHTFLPDNNGKPGAPREKAVPSEFPCPVCNQPLYRKEKEGDTYWACYKREGHANGENVFLPDDNGKPRQAKTTGTANCDGVRLPRLRQAASSQKRNKQDREGLGTF